MTVKRKRRSRVVVNNVEDAQRRLKALRATIERWEAKQRRAETAIRKWQRKLKAAERRYAWRNFVGWDKDVPMPLAVNKLLDGGALAAPLTKGRQA